MNIYLHELRAYRKSVLIWAVSLSLLIAFFLSIFPSFQQQSASINDVFQNMPKSVMDALGFSPDLFTSVLGFYTFTMTYIVLCAAVQAMNIGLGVLAKESSGKTVDFLLTKPVTRTAVITAKLLAAFTSLAITFLVFLAVSSIIAVSVSTQSFDYGMFLKLSLPLFSVQVIFAAVGFAIAAIARKIKSVLPLSLSTVFAFFIIGLVQGALSDHNLRYLTPFKYFDYSYILKNANFEGAFMAMAAVIVVVATVVSYIVYVKKDIHAA